MSSTKGIVDLFCGCGGFSLGAHQAGLGAALAIDVDPILTSSFTENYPETDLLLRDIASLSGNDLRRMLNSDVQGIYGGPPCQAFSSIGKKSADDPRRSLLGHFFRLVSETRPTFFVMENVVGLSHAGSIHLLEAALDSIPPCYNILGPIILNAADFGAATKRPRLFVIGYNPSDCDALTADDFLSVRTSPSNVYDAISDLKGATYVDTDKNGFDHWKISQPGRPNHYVKNLRSFDGTFTGHQKVKHSDVVTERFKGLEPGKTDPVGRHHRLRWDGQCPTLRAGTGNDRGSFQSVRPVHPDEPRVITVREAARLQGFPDEFRFHPTVWHSFRMIGNSVSPVISKAIFSLLSQRTELRSRKGILAA